ncbi:hypothetical protein FP2506_16959 [Fulvimarina pelagi HTCC2506]|uniref:Glycosyltransferase 2-like domain-containing protein n=1 Tax=Fulvimarina pelagi HTCC2506 TaxID=314231 RepID=Q0G2N8_9HYPH|nr:hypothetical protein FP2506_16959 [Fulvimarina pelagi HTCC2506]
MRERRYTQQAQDPVFLESYSLRTLALSYDLRAIPADENQREALVNPYQPLAADAFLAPLDQVAPRPVSLVILCRLVDLAGLRRPLSALSESFDDIVLVVDGEAPTREALFSDRVRIIFRSLAGDFAAQRNAGQELARHNWVLQLDSDEALTPGALASLGRVAAIADETGSVSIGLPRENRVDGSLSDLFPDIQYRLNRKNVRFTGRVHERPTLPRGWRDSFIAPNLIIEHRMERHHVEVRSIRYEALAPGRGRTFERDDLLRPYRP